MKSFLKGFFVLVSILSLFGIIFLFVYYIKKNFGLFKNLVKDIKFGLVSDLNVSDADVDTIKKDLAKIEERVEKDLVEVKDLVEDKISPRLPIVINLNKNKVLVNKKTVRLKKGELGLRQKEILNYAKLNSAVKMSDLSRVFKKVTPRTLRRDLGKLEQLGLLRQEGKTKDAIYKIV